MISYGKQTLDQSDIDAVLKVLNSDWLTQGPAVETFENDLQKYFGTRHACAVSNGTAALHLVAIALGWKPDDIIITSPVTFLASANCILYVGATPDFADIDASSYTIDPNKIEEKVKYYRLKGKSIKAIIGVDFAGHPCDWKGLRYIANKYDLQLVNDNCHSMGAEYLNKKHYAAEYADFVTQSYHPVKHLTTGEGGAILTNNTEFDAIVRRLRTHGMTKDINLMDCNDGPWYYEMNEVGFNYRITDFQCALGSSQLKKLDNFIKARDKIARKYDNSFSGLKLLRVPKTHNRIKHAYHLYPIKIDFEKLSISKVKFFEEMKNEGIQLQVHYIPIHLQPFYRKKFGFKKGAFSIAENFYHEEVSLPIYPDLSSNDQMFVIKKIKSYLNA